MNRVTIINLAGRAFRIEDDGVAAIERWLQSARATLAEDPDRDELLADFEQAIADRCAAQAPGETDVVTTEDVDQLLTALGPIEPADTFTADASEDDAPETTDAGNLPLRKRRLYRLTGENEGMIAGVCAGLASYLNVDVTVVRMVAVIVAVASFGAAVLAYAVLALIVPAADSPHDRMAAHGYGDSAREVMSRARANASPALTSLGSLIRVVGGAVTGVIYWSLVVALWAVLVAWTVAVFWVFADPDPLATAFDSGTSNETIAIWVSSAFWLAAGALILLAALARRLAMPSSHRRLGIAVAAIGVVTMTTAAISFVAIPLAASTQARSLLDGEGRIEIFGETWCLSHEDGFERDSETDRCEDLAPNGPRTASLDRILPLPVPAIALPALQPLPRVPLQLPERPTFRRAVLLNSGN